MDSSREPGQGGRPSSDPTSSSGGGSSSGWQSTPQSAGGSTSPQAGQSAGGSASWQTRPEQPSGATPPTWQSTPQPAPGQGGSTWTQPAAAEVRGTAGFVYADVPNRVIAFIIDIVVLVLIYIVVGIVGVSIGLVSTDPTNPFAERVGTGSLVLNLILIAIEGAYFILTWTSWRGSAGQRVLGMQVGNEVDGRTLTMAEAATRWALLFGPSALGQLVGSFSAGLGSLISLASFIWFIALLVTTAQSPTKQGLHDRYAHTVVVKAARAVG
jgi:uncharacterized RDD family membrane protein YckC